MMGLRAQILSAKKMSRSLSLSLSLSLSYNLGNPNGSIWGTIFILLLFCVTTIRNCLYSPQHIESVDQSRMERDGFVSQKQVD